MLGGHAVAGALVGRAVGTGAARGGVSRPCRGCMAKFSAPPAAGMARSGLTSGPICGGCASAGAAAKHPLACRPNAGRRSKATYAHKYNAVMRPAGHGLRRSAAMTLGLCVAHRCCRRRVPARARHFAAGRPCQAACHNAPDPALSTDPLPPPIPTARPNASRQPPCGDRCSWRCMGVGAPCAMSSPSSGAICKSN